MKKNKDPNKVSNFKNTKIEYEYYSSFCMKTKPNNRYSWKFFEGNISIKEKVKDEVAFYLNDQKISLNLILSGKDSEIYFEGENFDIKDIDKVKDDYLQLILDVFKDEGDNSF